MAAQQPLDLLVVGNDRISQQLLHGLGDLPGLKVFEDRSTGIARVLRLWRRGSLRVSDVVRMAAAEARRPQHPRSDWICGTITKNQDLLDAIHHFSPRFVFLFRAGLIVNRRVLDTGADILNIHCASIETHGGLASIRRALEDGALDQTATLHRVTTSVDEGEALAWEPYRLDPRRSYFWNEQAAYLAGISLASRLLKDRDIIVFRCHKEG